MMLRAVGLVAVVIGGCASIHVSESVTDTPLRPTVRHERVDGSVEYLVSATVRGDQVSLSVEQSETCAAVATQRSHRLTLVTRTGDPTVVRTTWLVATIGLGLGAYSYSNADDLAARSNMDSTAQEYRQYGIGLALVGLGAAALAGIDALRATDYERDDGVIVGESSRDESTCRRRKTRRKDVSLLLANGYQLSARLDAHGRADFTLLKVPESGIPADDTAIAATIDGAHLRVELSSEQRSELRSALLANPRSRLAIDLLEQRRAGCARGVATAQEATRDELDADPDGVQRAWLAAKASCDDLWTQELDVELADVDARIELARCNQRLVQAAASLHGEVSSEAIEDITADLASARVACPSAPHVAQLRQLDSRLAAVSKQIAREEAAAARRLVRDEARASKQAQRRQQTRKAPRQQSWGSARLRCNDGTLSPSCTCGRSSYRGCCSHHGGVDSCSVSSP